MIRQIAYGTVLFVLLLFIEAHATFILANKVLLVVILDLCVHLAMATDERRVQAMSNNKSMDSLCRENELLIKENAALSITIRNISDKHILLCEIRNTLIRQRRDSKELVALVSQERDIDKARHALLRGSQSESAICEK